MADADDKKAKDDAKKDDVKKEDAKVEKNDESQQTSGGIGIITWVIMAVIIVLCAGSGFLLGHLFAGPAKPETTQPSQTDKSTYQESTETDNSAANSENNWYYTLEPVVANLDEPGVTRYVRLTITLEISQAMGQDKVEKLLEDKKPILTSWLTIYLASLTLEDTRGDKNLKRIQLQILDAINEKLFPDAKPQIEHVFFKEFVVQ